jgi:hypothetical protein
MAIQPIFIFSVSLGDPAGVKRYSALSSEPQEKWKGGPNVLRELLKA